MCPHPFGTRLAPRLRRHPVAVPEEDWRQKGRAKRLQSFASHQDQLLLACSILTQPVLGVMTLLTSSVPTAFCAAKIPNFTCTPCRCQILSVQLSSMCKSRPSPRLPRRSDGKQMQAMDAPKPGRRASIGYCKDLWVAARRPKAGRALVQRYATGARLTAAACWACPTRRLWIMLFRKLSTATCLWEKCYSNRHFKSGPLLGLLFPSFCTFVTLHPHPHFKKVNPVLAWS